MSTQTEMPQASFSSTPNSDFGSVTNGKKSFFKAHATFLSIFFLVIGLVTIAAVFTTAQLTQKRSQDIRSDAATDVQVSFTFGNLAVSAPPNQEFSNTLKVNTNGKKLTAAEINLNFNPEFTQMTSLTPTDKLPVVLQAAAIDNTAGTAKIVLGANAGADAGFSGEGDIATVKMKGLKTTTSTVRLKYNASTLMAAVSGQDNNAAAIAGEVTITIGAATTPTAEITMPASTCNVGGGENKYKSGQALTFVIKGTQGSPAATETGLYIAKYKADGSDLESQGAQGASCLGGAGVISGPLGLWCKIATSAVTTANFESTATWSAPIVGTYVVTVNAIVPNATSCSGNPRCDFSTDSTLPKQTCSGFVNCSSKDWYKLGIADPSSCDTGNPTTGIPSLDAKFKLQGLKKAGVKQTATVTVKYNAPGQTTATTKTFTKEYTSDATGVLSAAAPLTLDGVSLSAAVQGAEVYVKTPTSIMKKVGTVTLTPNQTTALASDVVLPVGDFKNDGADANIIKLNDLALALTEFKQLENPVTDANRLYDVDFSGTFNLQDIAIVLTNFDQLEYPGERP